MNRPHYKDPLAAAWMAKYFGMKYICSNTNAPVEYSGAALDCSEDMRNDPSIKLVIHPESLHLLEPQNDDLVKVRKREEDGTERRLFPFPEFLTYNPHFAGDVICIVQRNRIAFIWPESES